jgi:hypothetical protein
LGHKGYDIAMPFLRVIYARIMTFALAIVRMTGAIGRVGLMPRKRRRLQGGKGIIVAFPHFQALP